MPESWPVPSYPPLNLFANMCLSTNNGGEINMKTLTKAQVFQHMADNVRNDKSATRGLMFFSGSTWLPLLDGHRISKAESGNIALKPRTHTLNGYDVPAPETEAPEVGVEYWTLDASEPDGVYEFQWGSDRIDQNALRHGLWLSKEDAIANRKALRGESPYE